MNTAPSRSVAPRDVARIMFRHWRKMALFFGGILGLTFVVIACYPRSYLSEAKLYIRVGRESVALDPTATTGDTILLQKTQVDEINSALDLLTSRATLQGAVDIVGAERILNDAPLSDGRSADENSSNSRIHAASVEIDSALSGVFKAVGLSDPGTVNDRAIRQLSRQMKAWAPKESTVITVTCTAASPALAHDIVEAITKTFVDQHVRLSQTEGSLQFFSAQVEKLFNELTAAEVELHDKKNSFQLTSNSRRASIIETSKDGLRQKIYQLQLAENELASRFTDEFPKLKELRRQREQAEAMLSQASNSNNKATATENTAQSEFGFKAVPAVTVSEKSGAIPDTDNHRSARVDLELHTLNDQDLQLTQLQRKVELLDKKYRMHVEKLEQARVNDALGRDRISNVNVAQPATLVTKPVSPTKPLILAVGLMIAVFGAVGLGFVAEGCDLTFRTTKQIEEQLGVPVLLLLPFQKRKRPNASAASISEAEFSKGNGKVNGEFSQLSNYRSLVHELMPLVKRGENGNKDGLRATTVGVVGCETSTLRSQVAGDLAIQAAQSGAKPVLLIDADVQRRNIANRFNINSTPGWCEILAGATDPKSCVHRNGHVNLAIMAPGHANGNTVPASHNAAQLDELKSEFGLVVVDLPSARDLDTASAGTTWLDETILVIEAERTHIQSAQDAKEALAQAGVHLKGVVLANYREHIPSWRYQRL